MRDGSYWNRHARVKRHRGRAAEHKCVGCGLTAEHWARVAGTDGKDIFDYQPMCAKCHGAYDAGGWMKVVKRLHPEQTFRE